MSAICIIPARGGSKRIPRKNIKLFLGKPIIAYSIEAALKSNLFDEVMVSTDDEEVAKVAIEYGAKVPYFRSEKNSDDFATTFDVIDEVIDYYKSKSQVFELTCCLYPTAPFITPDRLCEAHELLRDKINAVFTVVPYSYPIQRSLSLDDKGVLRMNWTENLKKRSQDLKTNFHDAGQFYFYKTESYLRGKGVFNMQSKPLILSELEVQDIDNETDWKLAELKFKLNG